VELQAAEFYRRNFETAEETVSGLPAGDAQSIRKAPELFKDGALSKVFCMYRPTTPSWQLI
jgi:hypothetical protein